MEKIRNIIFYKSYFQEFYLQQDEKQKGGLKWKQQKKRRY